jgi:hypothetical protein
VDDAFQEFEAGDDLTPVVRPPRPRGKDLWPLTVELVPKSSWGNNLRARMSRAEWDRVKKNEAKRAGGVCEICGGTGYEQGYHWAVECHEVWDYNDRTGVQSLVRLISICPRCHKTKHFGLAEILGDREHVIQHLMEVNEWSRPDAERHVRQAFRLWEERSQRVWVLDLRWMKEHYGITFGVPL